MLAGIDNTYQLYYYVIERLLYSLLHNNHLE